MAEAIRAPRQLAIHHRQWVEVLDLSGDTHIMAARIEPGDTPYPRFPRAERRPCACGIIAQRCHQPDTCDYDPSRHLLISPLRLPSSMRRVAPDSTIWYPKNSRSASLRTLQSAANSYPA